MKSTTDEGTSRDRDRARAGCSRVRSGGRAAGLAAGALLGAAVAALGGDARAETADLPRVTYYPDLRAFSKPLPTKTQFIVEIPLTAGGEAFDEVELRYWKASDDGAACPPDPPAGEKIIGAKQSLNKGAGRFEVPIQALTHSARYCFDLAFSRPVSEREQDHLKRLLSALVERALGTDGLDADLGKPVAEIFKDYGAHTTPDGKKLLEQINAWLKQGDVMEVRQRIAGAAAQQRAAGENMATHCNDVSKLPAIEALKPRAAGAAGSPADAIKASVEELKKEKAALTDANSWCPRLPDTAKLPAALDQAALKAGQDLGRFASSAGKVMDQICPGKPSAALFDNADKVCKQIEKSSALASTLGDDIAQAKSAGDAGVAATDDLVARFKERFGRVRFLVRVSDVSTPVPSYAERAGLYISGDVGVMVPIFYGSGEFGLSPLVGANFYLGPVDKDEPLSIKKLDFLRRFAVTGGIAINVKDPAGTTSGIFGDASLFAGIGMRLTDYLRLGGGLTFVNQKDPDPLVTGQRIRALPYGAVSVDVDVAGTVKDIYTKGRSAL